MVSSLGGRPRRGFGAFAMGSCLTGNQGSGNRPPGGILGSMSTTTDRRASLRTEARRRERTLLPKLRAKLKAAKEHKAKRLKRCQDDCRKRRAKVRDQAAEARRKLRERLAAAKQQARDFCSVCKVSASGAELDRIDAALGALQEERATIQRLRSRASGMVDERGSAAGKRSAEIRAELQDEVARNVGDDPELAALWEAQTDKYRRFRPTSRTTMTERFLEWVEAHPEALDELRNELQQRWEVEAEILLGQWPRERPIADMSEAELARLQADHKRVAIMVGDESDADNLRFAEMVHDAARDPKTTKLGGSRAFLRSVYRTLRGQHVAITWPQFKDALLAANEARALRLSRAELVPLSQRALMRESAIPFRDTAFHLVDVPSEIPF